MDFECYEVQKGARNEIDRLLNGLDSITSPYSVLASADSRREYSDLFGTLIHKRLATDSVIYNSPTLLALNLPDIVYDGKHHNPANDVKEPIIKLLSSLEETAKEIGCSSSSIARGLEEICGVDQYGNDNETSESSRDDESNLGSSDHLISPSPSAKLSRPYFSMVTKEQFFQTLYPKLQPVKWHEGSIISCILSALRGSHRIYLHSTMD